MSVPETPSAKRYAAMIVCSDDRAKILAARLTERFEVYVIRSNGASGYRDGRLEPIGMVSLPVESDVLFYHTGSNDPDRIPEEFKARMEFAFSGGDEPFTNRPGAYKIYPPFIGEQCPVDNSAVTQIIDLLEGRRTQPPSICMRARTDSPLAALAILCQGYLSVNAEGRSNLSGPERKAVDRALARMGWNIASEDPSLKHLLKNLSIHKRKVSSVSWWARPFIGSWSKPGTPHRLDTQTFLSDLKDEWRRIGGDLSMFPHIRELTLAFTNETQPDETTLTLPIVAAAYTALADTLMVD